jgi:flagellar hook-associated protein 3 FlgL
MRVTSNSFTESFVNQLNLLSARQARLQQQAATGQRIRAPEDDPAAMQRTMALRNENQTVAQYAANIALLKDRATSEFSALQAIKKNSDRAGEIATLAGGTRSPEELQAYAREVTQMIQQAVQTMNSRYRDQYLFAGTLSDQPPFAITLDGNGNVTSVTYQGNTSVAQNEIDNGATIAVDVPGENNSGTGPRGLVSDNRVGADFFNHLIALQNHLLAGDASAIQNTDLPALRADEDNFIYHVSNNGAVQTRLETAATIAGDRSLSLQQMISKEADADLTDTMVQLSQTQNAYQAALQSGALIMQTSLLDYLR